MTNLNLLKVLMFFAFPLLFFSCSDKEENASTGIDNTNVTPEMDVSCDPPCEEWCFDNQLTCDFTFYWFYDCADNSSPVTLYAGIQYIGPPVPPNQYCLIPPCAQGFDCDPECPLGWKVSGDPTEFTKVPTGNWTWYISDPNSCCYPNDVKIFWNQSLQRFIISCDS